MFEINQLDNFDCVIEMKGQNTFVKSPKKKKNHPVLYINHILYK